MTAESKVKALAAGMTVTLFATLIGTGILYRDNTLLGEDIKAEKVRTERLEAERSSLKQEMEKLRVDLNNYTATNGALNLAIQDAKLKLADKEARINQLTKEKGSLDQLKKENAAIRKIRQELVAQLETMKNSNSLMQAEITELNKTIAALRKENDLLYARANTKTTQAYNFRTEVVRGKKDRLTVKARRTHLFKVSFDVNNPGELQGDIYVKVQNPDAKEISGALTILDDTVMQPELLTASISEGWMAAKDYRRLSLSFDPTDKLAPGIYNIMVYSGNNYLGSTQVKLR